MMTARGGQTLLMDELHPALSLDAYVFWRKSFRARGAGFQVYDEFGEPILRAQQPSFSFGDEFTLVADVGDQPVLKFRTPEIVGPWPEFEVWDMVSMRMVGSVRRGARSIFFKDEWTLTSREGRDVGKLSEMAGLRSLLGKRLILAPQDYFLCPTNGEPVAIIHHHLNPLAIKYTMNILDPDPGIDRRLLLAAGILLAAFEA